MLTAHPTEVQRKSILDTQLEIARLLTDRSPQQLTPEELAEKEDGLRRLVLTLWQTRALLSNLDMVLGKSDMSIASRYAELVGDEDNRRAVFARLQSE